MSDVPEKKIQASSILIALLMIVVVAQAAVLIYQGRKQAAFETKQCKLASPPQQSQASSPRAGVYSRTPAALRAFPAAPRGAGYDDPWEAFDQMTQRMNSLMQHAFTFGSPLFQNMPQGTGFDFTPAVDLEETQDAYILKSDLPGLEKDKIHLTVRENVLTIEGIRETTNETGDANQGYYAQERSYGSFARSLSLPGPVDESKIAAAYKDGVLTITLPKVPGEKSAQKVEIQ